MAIFRQGKEEYPDQTASYIIFIDGSIIKAQNGSTGNIDYQGSDAATVIQAAIDAMTTGGKIFIKAGTYTINDSITIEDGITLEGENYYNGSLCTFLTLANGINKDVITSSSIKRLEQVQIKNLTINANPANQSSGSAIKLYSPYEGLIENIWIQGAKDDGIEFLKAGADIVGTGTTIRNCHIGSCGQYGISNDAYTTDIDIDNCIVWEAGSFGIVVMGMNYIRNSEVYDCENGIFLNWSGNTTIEGCVIHLNNKIGISGFNCTDCIISGNVIMFNSQNTSNSYSGIWIDSNGDRPAQYNKIIGNTIGSSLGTEKQHYGVETVNSSANNIIIGNSIINNVSGAVSLTGTNIISDNAGYVNHNKGIAATIADGGTIDHGLVTTPTTARVSGSVAGEMVAVTALDATHITVAIKKHDGSAGTTQTIYWDADV